MRIFLTGATGFIGRSLVQRLLGQGHEVSAWVRDLDAARARLGPDVGLVATSAGRAGMQAAVDRADAVVNLAGEPLFNGRWNAAKKERMVSSRVDLTRDLVEAMRSSPQRPRALVSASAIGIYGDRGDEVLNESSTHATGYLADLCEKWEAAARGAEALGVRTTLLRIGIVLGPDGGALAQMLPIFRLGGGGPLGSGTQKMSWIHIDDMVEMIVHALENEAVHGVLNATAPLPVTNRDFSTELGRALNRPAFLPAPAFAVRLLLGESSQVVLGGQHVLPTRCLETDFRFRFCDVRSALEDLVGLGDGVAIEAADELPEGDYLAARGARYRLAVQDRVDAPLEQVSAFFSRAENLGLLTPSWLKWRVLRGAGEEMGEGLELEYKIWLGPIPMSWKTRIAAWQPPRRFVDTQLSGPYASWHHEHRFVPDEGGTTLCEDVVHYSPPLGILGRLAHPFFVAPALRAIFGYRREAIRRLFGDPDHRPGDATRRPDPAEEAAPQYLDDSPHTQEEVAA